MTGTSRMQRNSDLGTNLKMAKSERRSEADQLLDEMIHNSLTDSAHRLDPHSLVLSVYCQDQQPLIVAPFELEGLIYEKADEVNFFPHFYGPSKTYYALPPEAVTKAEKFSLVAVNIHAVF